MGGAIKADKVSGPLPETAQEPVLVRMLDVAPTEGGNGEDRGANISPEGATEEGGSKSPSLQGEKRTASEDLKIKASKRGKISLSGGSGSGGDMVTEFLRKDKPLAES